MVRVMRYALASLSVLSSTVLCLLFSLLIVSTFWPGIAGIPLALILVVMALRRSKLLIILWLAGIPTIFVYGNNLLGAIPMLRVERAFLPLFVLGLLSSTRLWHAQRKPLLEIEKIMLALLFVASVSMVWSSVGKPTEVLHQNVWLYTESLLVPFFGFYLARRQQWTAKDIDLLITALMVAALYLAIVGALQLFLGMNFFYPHYIDPPAETGRASGVFSSPNQYGFVMMIFAFLAIYRYARSNDGIVRILFIGAIALALFGLGICKTRAPWFGTLIGLGSIYLADRRVRGLIQIGAVLLVVGIIAALPFLIESGLLEYRILDLEPLYPRLAAYTTALNIIAQNPLTGLGFGPLTFSLAKPIYGTTFGLISTNWTLFASIPHNEYLHMLVLMGVVGFVPFIMLLRQLFRLTAVSATTLAAVEAEWLPEFAVYVRAVVVAYLFAALLVDVMMFQYFMTLMYFLVGICASGTAVPTPAPFRNEAGGRPS